MSVLYTAKPCGCLVLVMVNEVRNLRDCADDISRELREGRTRHEATKETLPPFDCAEHKGKRHKSEGKPVFGHPEWVR